MIKPTDNYLENILDSGIPCRWNKPLINVYIYEDTVYKYKKEEIISKTITAFQNWESALENKLSFSLIDTPNEADILVQYQRNECNGEIGVCQYTQIAENGAFQKMDVCIGLIYSHLFLQNAMHEIGHALGLMGHSSCAKDLMFSSISYQNLKLTQRDINTINLLYNLPLTGEEVSIFANEEPDSNPIFDELKFLPEYSLVDPGTLEKSLAIYQKGGDLNENLDKISELKIYQLTLQNLNIKTEYKIY